MCIFCLFAILKRNTLLNFVYKIISPFQVCYTSTIKYMHTAISPQPTFPLLWYIRTDLNSEPNKPKFCKDYTSPRARTHTHTIRRTRAHRTLSFRVFEKFFIYNLVHWLTLIPLYQNFSSRILLCYSKSSVQTNILIRRTRANNSFRRVFLRFRRKKSMNK